MGVYLGNEGFIELKRDSQNDPIRGVLAPDDVNTTRNRFSFDFDINALNSGDQVDIVRTDAGKDLVLVDGSPAGNSARAFIHVDYVGGIRLYDTFNDAVSDNQSAAIQLVAASENQNISVTTRNSNPRCVAQVTSYEVTTSRETVDTSSIGDEFRRNFANGLISGQGSMECLWDYKSTVCDDTDFLRDTEFPHYLAQLVIRTEQGADFTGFFYLDHSVEDHYVWYEAECIVTNVAMTVEPTQLIRTRVQFVTTGEIRLKIGMPPLYVTQEDGSLILQEDDVSGLLQEAD